MTYRDATHLKIISRASTDIYSKYPNPPRANTRTIPFPPLPLPPLPTPTISAPLLGTRPRANVSVNQEDAFKYCSRSSLLPKQMLREAKGAQRANRFNDNRGQSKAISQVTFSLTPFYYFRSARPHASGHHTCGMAAFLGLFELVTSTTTSML